MNLQLKITLALLGVVASMASLGVLGIGNYFESREAGAELQQLNDQRFLAQQVRGDLDRVVVLALRAYPGMEPEAREQFRFRAAELLATLAELSDLAVDAGVQDLFVILEREIVALRDEYRLAHSGRPSEAASAMRSIAERGPRIRRRDAQVRSLLLESFLQHSDLARQKIKWSYVWLYSSLLGAMLVSVGFGFLLHRMILGPLAELREATERIRTGDLDVALEVHGNDELADVTRAFVDMSQSLRNQFEEEERLIHGLDEANERLQQERRDFEQLVEIGKVTSSTLDFLEVLGVLTTRAHTLIPCQRCSIFRPEPDDPGRAMILSSTHYPAMGPKRIDLAGYPEVRLAIDRHETVQVDDVASDELMRDVADAALQAGVSSVLSVPMIYRSRLLGAVVFMRGGDEAGGFSTWERCIAESIAGIGAVCMENADLYGSMQRSRNDVEGLNLTLRQTVEELRGTQDRLVASERLAAVGGVSASIAHSLRNPLAAIRAMAQSDLERGGGSENLPDIIKMVDRLGSYMNQILDFCKTGHEVRSSLDPNRTVESVIEMLRAQAESRQVAVIPKLAPDLPRLSANPERFERAVLSVVENAIEACEPGRRVEIVTRREGATGVLIEVRDEGPGIPDDVLSRIFEPFFSTKTSGTGLGTTIARTVVESLQGTVDVGCAPEGGALFLMHIPGTSA